MISHIPHTDRGKKGDIMEDCLMEKSKYSSWNKVLPIWSKYWIALGLMPVLGHLLGPGSMVMGQEPSSPTVAAWGAKNWGVKGALGASWPTGGVQNSCSCQAKVPTEGHFKKSVIQAEWCCGLDRTFRTFFGPFCIISKAKALLWLLLWQKSSLFCGFLSHGHKHNQNNLKCNQDN